MLAKLLQLAGWPRMLLMFACGAMAALALAPVHWWWLLPVAYGLFFYHLHAADSAKRAFRLGWWWGFGFFLAGLYWICISMTVDLARFGWMIPFALGGLNGGLALFTALAGWAYAQLGFTRRPMLLGWLVFSLLLFASEWLRGHILTGFPWNLAGYAWGTNYHAIQAASLLPLYPLTLLTIVLASSAGLWRKTRLPLLASAVVVIGFWWYGELRLREATPYKPAQSMRLVQGNVAQHLKWKPAHQQQAFSKHVSMSIKPLQPPELIVWPESALPYAIQKGAIARDAFSWLKPNQTLITGAVVLDGARATNSMVAIDHNATLLAQYDKQHLVPFGEYVPLSQWLPLEKLTQGVGAFTPGEGERRFLNFHPLVCYEIIFPGYAAGTQSVILNLTNDDWFGYSSGPFQHLMAARFRAVEQGKPVLRVANSGISAVIDAYGRLQEQLPLHEAGVIDLE